jgi:hypothetical protein
MPIFLVEVHVPGGRQLELDRARRMLESAQARMSGSAMVTTAWSGGPDGGGARLVCVIEGDSVETARRLIGVALVPHGRIREISEGARDRLFRARYPPGDVDPGLETELVQDVVDVRLDGPLGQE